MNRIDELIYELNHLYLYNSMQSNEPEHEREDIIKQIEQLRPYVTLAEWVLVHSVSILDAFNDSKRFKEAMIYNQLMKSTNKSINNQKENNNVEFK